MKFNRSLVTLALFLATAPLFADTYTIDKAHSEALFSVRHLMSKVSGKFDDINAVITIEPKNLTGSTVDFTIKAASIDTGIGAHDNHLRSGDFFDVEKTPDITFKSVAIRATGKKDVYSVTGDLTIRGVTRRITLPVTVMGFGKDPAGKEKAGFTAATTINRKDFGVNWNKSLDSGGVLLGDDVDVTVNIEAFKSDAAAGGATKSK